MISLACGSHGATAMILERIRTGDGAIAKMLRKTGSTAVGTYAAYVAYGVLHPDLLRTGTTPEEAGRSLPGDDVVRDPHWQTTFATTIAAPPREIWPWLVQIGWGRAGWYTWYPLDNGGVPSADHIVPDLQRLAVGDLIPDGPRASEGLGVWRVDALDPERSLVLFSRRNPVTGREVPDGDTGDDAYIECTWVFVLEEIAPETTRLTLRVRAKVCRVRGGIVIAKAARLFFGLGDNVFERTMLEGVRERVEKARAARV